MGQAANPQKPFLTDVKTLRERARQNLNDGALGSNYIGDVNKTSLAASRTSIPRDCSRVPPRNMSKAKTWWT